MSNVEPKLREVTPAREAELVEPAPASVPESAQPHSRLLRVLVTSAAVAIAVPLSWAMWNTYMGTPWTRDGTVRVYVVTMAPEVAGRIIELPVVDNLFVHKGDLLMVIDPTNYKIAVDLARAAVGQARANVQNIDAQIAAQQSQVTANEAEVERAQAALTFAQQQAARYRDLAEKEVGTVQMEQQTASTLRQDEATLRNAQAALTVARQQIETLKAQRAGAEATLAQAQAQLDQARVNLNRTQIHSPVNGWVTNLLAQLGDYANVGQNEISVVDADSFWVDAYFTETTLAPIRAGDPANIKLMGYSEIVRGHVGSISRGINIQNAQGGSQGLQTVNPIFTWVRLAQRIPVRINIDHVPDGVTLAAGLTATVEIEPRARPPQPPAATRAPR
jgi:multidrug resistance efflux pump